MGKRTVVELNSRWRSKDGRIWVVLERKPFGLLEVKQEDRFLFGITRQRDFVANHTPA
ncbi:hypothetical protein [Achromobacter denitrificans]|uniref:hypothetical protein n=1 Tax=Achromobacter denitrificans TaxID=32002 RepID=UPI00240CE8B4|nr:hypothetical protein [Achromobacter denitrificans]